MLPFRSEPARTRAHRFLVRSKLPLGPVSPLTKKALKYGTLGPGRARPSRSRRWPGSCTPAARASAGRGAPCWRSSTSRSRASALAAPTAVIVGTHDRLTPPVLARELADALPHLTGLHELPRRGHMTPIESPGEVTGVLRALVRDHLAGSGTAAAEGTHAAKKEEIQ